MSFLIKILVPLFERLAIALGEIFIEKIEKWREEERLKKTEEEIKNSSKKLLESSTLESRLEALKDRKKSWEQK